MPRGQFETARDLFEKEEYSQSISMLQKVVKGKSVYGGQGGVTMQEVLVLLGWNFLAERDFASLKTLDRTISRLGVEEIPEFELIRIWSAGIKGNIQESIQRATVFLDGEKHQVHRLHPDFLMLRGHCFSLAGDSEAAIRDCEAAYAIFGVQDRVFSAGRAANILGYHLFSVGKYFEAIEWFSRAEDIFQTLNLLRKISVVALHLGLVHYKLGNFSRSLTYLQKSLRIGVEGDWKHRQCFANIALGNVFRMQRDFRSARQHLMNGYQQAQELTMAREEALALEFLGDVYRDEGKFSEALSCYARTMAIAEPLAPAGDIVAEVERRRGECYVLSGEITRAWPHLDKALGLTRRQKNRFEEAVTLRVFAEAHLVVGDPQLALGLVVSACKILESIGANFELAIACLRRAEILLVLSSHTHNDVSSTTRLDEAWNHATTGLKLFQDIKVPWWLTQANNLVRRVSRQSEQEEKSGPRCVDAGIGPGTGESPNNVIVYKSEAIHLLLDLCDHYATSDHPVLIRGETGTGKELIARRLHEKSGLKGKLVAVNVASVPASLFEREFFGHAKGAFSGADSNKIGYAEQADGGTLFLDEIGELPLDLQPKLLRLLQDGTFHALGDPNQRRVNIRLVAATNLDLHQATLRHAFREDLYYRLQILPLSVPPLRDRAEDILPLMRHFLSLAAGQAVTVSDYLNPVSEVLASEYSWPGNVRELIAVCQRIFLQYSTMGSVKVELGHQGVCSLKGPGFLELKGTSLDAISDSRQRLHAALQLAGGNRAKAARILGISRSTLYRKMSKIQE